MLNVKKLKAVRGSYLPSVIKHALFPLWDHEPSSELLRFVRGVCPNFRHTCQFFYHIILVAWHYINQGFMGFWFFLFFGIKMPCHSMLSCVIAVRPICLKISSNLLHMELNRTQEHEIWVFKLLWLAIACTCSSNFNYGH